VISPCFKIGTWSGEDGSRPGRLSSASEAAADDDRKWLLSDSDVTAAMLAPRSLRSGERMETELVGTSGRSAQPDWFESSKKDVSCVAIHKVFF
jgi:hypothetical protein